MSKKLIAILLSAAMTFTPMAQSMPVYAAEVETQNEMENLGTMPQADELDDADADDVSDDGDAEEAAGEEQAPDGADAGDTAKDDVSDDNSKDNDSDEGKDADTGKVEENTETKTETKTEAKEDTEPKETVSDPVYEEVLEEESESATGSEEESETESEEMSQEDVGIASFSNIKVSDIKAGGWNESIYAEISKVTDASAITKVSWTGTDDGELDTDGLKYLVRIPEGETGVRIDIPGLKAGTYRLSITVNGTGELTYAEDIKVYAYDRSGYAHFNYSEGVGAYKDDGTLKAKAQVIYVTPDTVNTVELKVGNTTVKGIGNILNSVGKACGDSGHDNQCKRVSGGKTYYGIANTNQGIIQKLSEADTPLVVRFVGTISESGLKKQAQYNANHEGLIDGLTAYNSNDYGGIPGDNGHMARIKSGKNITLEGIGYDAVIDGWGFHFMAESATADQGFGKGFEVRNLKFINTPEDAIGMEGIQESGEITASVERCWIHNNEFYCPNIGSPAEDDKAQGDGSVDFKRGMYFTCSYNYYDGCHKTNLVGSSKDSLQYNLTYHHNHWKNCEARGPLSRQANIHMYNNIIDMQSDYAMNTRAYAFIFSEYNLFYACKNPQQISPKEYGGGPIKSFHDSFASAIGSRDGTIVTDKMQKIPNNCKYLDTDYSSFETDSKLSYIPIENGYKLDTDFTYLRKVIISQTGVQTRSPKLPEKVTASEYSMLPSGTTVTAVDSLPKTFNPGKLTKRVFAFSVTGAVDVEIDYAVPSGQKTGVLVNEAGECLLEGNGKAINLPAGTYWIQAVDFATGNEPSFKDLTVNSVNITAHNPNAHYHNWVLDSEQSKDATCTEDGEKVYTCVGDKDCDENRKKVETISALGHSYELVETTATCTMAGVNKYKCSRCNATKEEAAAQLAHNYKWVIDKEATKDETGLKHQECTMCHDRKDENTVIPAGDTGTGDNDDPSDGVVFHGDHVLTFEGGKANGATDFFTLAGGSYGDTTDKRTPTVNGTKYQAYYQLNNGDASIKFTCEDDAILFIAASTDQNGSKIKINGTKTPTDSKATLTKELTAGEYTITKDAQLKICYLAVANKKSVVYHTLSFVYNYSGETGDDEDEPDPRTMQIVEGQTYNSMAALVPSTFTRTGYKLKGLYEDAACTKPINYPYKVSKDVDFYAQWEEDDTPDVETWTLYFNTNGGLGISPVNVPKNQVYEINQIPIKDGYIFTGWYDQSEGGNLVSRVDGSKMTENMTIYAYWIEVGGSDYLISFDANGGTAPEGLVSVVKKADDTINIPGDCIPEEGYVFKGWSIDGETLLTDTYTVSAADADDGVITIIALYEKEDGSSTSNRKGIYIEGLKDTYDFTGDKITPAFDVVHYDDWGKKVLSLGVDYTVTYKNNKDISTNDKKAEIIVKGKGNYANVAHEFFMIVEPKGGTDTNLIPIKGAKIEKIDSMDYDGTPKYPTVKLTLKGETTPVEYKYQDGTYIKGDGTQPMDVKISVSNNVNKGNATILVTGAKDNNKETKVKAKFKITAVSLENATVTPSTDAVYSPNGAVPKNLTVTCGGKTLVSGRDYTVKYSKNKTVGKGTVTVTGKGNYTKKAASVEYPINPADISDFTVSAVTAYTGIKAGKIKATVVDKKGNALKAKQYKLEVYPVNEADGVKTTGTKYEDGEVLNEGGKTIRVVAVANDETNLIPQKSTYADFKVGTDISKAKFTLKKGLVKEYTGAEIKLTEDDFDKDNVTIKVDGDIKKLTMGKDYEIASYSNNINKGTATAVIAGKGDYSGTKTIKFKIGQKKISELIRLSDVMQKIADNLKQN